MTERETPLERKKIENDTYVMHFAIYRVKDTRITCLEYIYIYIYIILATLVNIHLTSVASFALAIRSKFVVNKVLMK